MAKTHLIQDILKCNNQTAKPYTPQYSIQPTHLNQLAVAQRRGRLPLTGHTAPRPLVPRAHPQVRLRADLLEVLQLLPEVPHVLVVLQLHGALGPLPLLLLLLPRPLERLQPALHRRAHLRALSPRGFAVGLGVITP